MPDAEFDTVLRVASPLVQLAMLLAREAGLRHQTILEFAAQNCDFEHNVITGRTKAHGTYTVPMTTRLRERLRWIAAQSLDPKEPFVCQFNRIRKQPHYNTITVGLASAKRRAGITATWGYHDMRRTLARDVYDRTLDLRKVRSLLGHQTIKNTLWYLGNTTGQLTAEDMERNA